MCLTRGLLDTAVGGFGEQSAELIALVVGQNFAKSRVETGKAAPG